VYDGWNLLASLNPASSVRQAYLWGLDLSGTMQGAGGVGGLLAITDASQGSHFCAYDGNGNVAALMKADGSGLTAQYEYGPFGELLRATEPMAKANPFRFSTKYQDDESDLIYYGYRYYNASTGRWLSRDPLGEAGGKNLYVFVLNDPLRYFDFLGLEGCNLSYSFDDDDEWWEKTAFPGNTKWLQTLDEAKKDIKQHLKTCCCINKIYFTQHNGVPGILQIGEGSIPINVVKRIESETDAARRRILQESIQREQNFLKFIKKFMCKGGKVFFVQCQAGAGPEGEELEKWLRGFFGPNVDVTLYAEGVRWFYGSPKECKVKEQ